ncbi:hypothetical protein [Mucilaginibacter sp.]
MQATESYYKLRELNIDSVIHPEWGINDFSKLKPIIESLLKMMLRMGNNIAKVQEIPIPLAEKGNEIIDRFYASLNGLSKFDIVASRNLGFKDQDAMIKSADKIFFSFLTGSTSLDSNSEIFLNIYNSIISFEDNRIEDLSSQFSLLGAEFEINKNSYLQKNEELEKAQKQYQDLIELLTNKAKEITTEDYAEIFKSEADHNKVNSYIWLSIAIISFILFLLFLKNEDYLLAIDPNKSSTVITIEYLKRLLVVSFLIYVITFIIKQYSIKKHLQTINTHRQNTLNSYNLFLKSMGTADQDIRNSLMVEVARAIYESGQTGYINSKDDNTNSSSILEVTKFIKPNS